MLASNVSWDGVNSLGAFLESWNCVYLCRLFLSLLNKAALFGVFFSSYVYNVQSYGRTSLRARLLLPELPPSGKEILLEFSARSFSSIVFFLKKKSNTLSRENSRRTH